MLSEVTARIAEAQRRGYRELVLSDLRVASLPESVGNLTYLTRVDLSGNQLTKLPESLGSIAGLRRLYVSRNRLAALPESMVNLVQLSDLGLEGNQFTELPEFMRNLRRPVLPVGGEESTERLARVAQGTSGPHANIPKR
jgi:Leucine-rich repeat (LRR) protein